MNAAWNEQADTMLACGHAANAIDAKGDPSCAICVGLSDTSPVAPPDLTGRVAKCCGDPTPSKLSLAFFEYRGEGSRAATDTCKHCRYARVAHERKQRGENISSHVCDSFESHGAWDHDLYYCGCRGWD